MPIYIVIPLVVNSAKLDAAVKATVRLENRFQLQAERGWLVKFDGTTIEASNFIGITGQESGAPALLGSALISPMTSYYGRGPAEMWEWLKTRFEQ